MTTISEVSKIVSKVGGAKTATAIVAEIALPVRQALDAAIEADNELKVVLSNAVEVVIRKGEYINAAKIEFGGSNFWSVASDYWHSKTGQRVTVRTLQNWCKVAEHADAVRDRIKRTGETGVAAIYSWIGDVFGSGRKKSAPKQRAKGRVAVQVAKLVEKLPDTKISKVASAHDLDPATVRKIVAEVLALV